MAEGTQAGVSPGRRELHSQKCETSRAARPRANTTAKCRLRALSSTTKGPQAPRRRQPGKLGEFVCGPHRFDWRNDLGLAGDARSDQAPAQGTVRAAATRIGRAREETPRTLIVFSE